MEIKNKHIIISLLLIILVLIIILSLIINNGDYVEVSGMKFNIPEGYYENNSYDVDLTPDYETRYFDKSDRTPLSTILICVSQESGRSLQNLVDDDDNISTIDGREGIFIDGNSTAQARFIYVDEGKLIIIYAENKAMIEEIIV